MNHVAESKTRYIGTSVCRLSCVESTQVEARRLIAAGQGDGALVVAESQTAGRGRFAREWQSPAGNLYVSFILRPPMPLAEWPQVMMLAALALSETFDDLGVAQAAIKWPNDILVGESKVAGMLSEVAGAHLILGIGVNVNAPVPTDLPHATSLRAALGRELELETFLQALVVRLDNYYVQLLSGRRFTAPWAARLVTLGQTVRVLAGDAIVKGIADSVDSSGALRVRQRNGTLAILHSGEVTLSSQGGDR